MKIKTAEEVAKGFYDTFPRHGTYLPEECIEEIKTLLILFADIHVKAALKSACEKAKLERISDSQPGRIFDQDNYGQLCVSGLWSGQYIRVNIDSILNSYPPEKYLK